jgi:hypothetical protein
VNLKCDQERPGQRLPHLTVSRWYGIIRQVEIVTTPMSRHVHSGRRQEFLCTPQVDEIADDHLVPRDVEIPAKVIVVNLQMVG